MIVVKIETDEEVPIFDSEDGFPMPSASYPERGFILFQDLIPDFGITYGKTKLLIEQLQSFVDECDQRETS